MCKIVFVVLHYETVDDTKTCIDSLLNYLDGDSVQIVVVDNGSKKGKLERSGGLYDGISQLHFLYSAENLGFAKGNNIGFLYAKKQLNADVIVLTNNDIVFKQNNFIELLLQKYDSGFDVAGPKIISLVDSKNQNPVPRIYKNIYDVKKRIAKFKILYLLSWFNIDLKLKSLLSKKKNEIDKENKEDFQLHGSCMFFAHEYLKKYNGLFDKTFMYGEESILKYMVDHNNLRMAYYKDLTVYHKEGGSTKSIWGKGKARRQFFYKWNIDSCKLLENLMNEKK